MASMTLRAPINAMRFSLRTLLILLLVVPPLIAGAWAQSRIDNIWIVGLGHHYRIALSLNIVD